MAVAACFGGPMLNILLGVGLSGTYLILLGPARGQSIHVAMGRTLCVSGVGLLAILLATLIVVPLNGYRMSKRVGASLIAAYIVCFVLSGNKFMFPAARTNSACPVTVPLMYEHRRRDLAIMYHSRGTIECRYHRSRQQRQRERQRAQTRE